MVIDPRELTWRQNPQAVLQGEIDRDIPCRRCGYNLRGLTVNAVCPECGHDVGHSALGNSIEHADPHWLQRMAIGGMLLIAATALALPLSIILMIGAVPISTLGPWRIAIVLCTMIGGWLFTSREPDAIINDRPAIRHAARWTLMLACALALLQPDTWFMQLIIAITIMLASILGLLFVRHIAYRCRDEALGRHAFLIVISVAGWFALATFWDLAIMRQLPQTIYCIPGASSSAGLGESVLQFAFDCFSILITTPLWIWWLILLLRLTHTFHHVANRDAA